MSDRFTEVPTRFIEYRDANAGVLSRVHRDLLALYDAKIKIADPKGHARCLDCHGRDNLIAAGSNGCVGVFCRSCFAVREQRATRARMARRFARTTTTKGDHV